MRVRPSAHVGVSTVVLLGLHASSIMLFPLSMITMKFVDRIKWSRGKACRLEASNINSVSSVDLVYQRHETGMDSG